MIGKHGKVCCADHSARHFELVEGEPVYGEDVPIYDGEGGVERQLWMFCPLDFLPDYLRRFFHRYQYQDKYPHTAKAYDEEYQWVLNASEALERNMAYYEQKFKG